MAKPAILQVTAVQKIFHSGGIFSRKKLVAVDGVSLALDEKPQVFSIVEIGRASCRERVC